MEEIGGNHSNGKSAEVVEAFDNTQTLGSSSIPQNINKFFTNILVIRWGSSNLGTITAEDLKPFENLKELFLYFNKIVAIDGDLFRYNRKLQWIDFSGNKIEHVGKDLFTGLKDLKVVYFESNPCTEGIAYTPVAIQELNIQLPIRCPPFAATGAFTTISTTEANHCTARFETNEELDELRRLLHKQTETIAKQEQMNSEHEQRIGKIEKQLKELSGNLCSSDEIYDH